MGIFFKKKKKSKAVVSEKENVDDYRMVFQIRSKPFMLIEGDEILCQLVSEVRPTDRKVTLTDRFIQVNRPYKGGERFILKLKITPIANGDEERGLYYVEAIRPGKEEVFMCNDPYSPFGFSPIVAVYEKINK